MGQLRFGTGGVPSSAKSSSTIDGLRRLAELDLDCMEIEFVHGVRLKQEKAEEIGRLAEELDVSLTAHGPYYINLYSLEKQKIGASRARLVQTALACSWMNARAFTFHAAFYQGRDEVEVYDAVKAQIIKIQAEMAKKEVDDILIRPETTGKPTQFGSLDELIKLAKELDGVSVCVDFAHLHARSGGEVNSYDEFVDVLKKVKKGLGAKALKDMHMHMSGINYTAKGERNHLVLDEADMNWQELMQALKDFGVGGVLICESPNLEEDAIKMRDYYHSLNR